MIPFEWTKSSKCDAGSCVEVLLDDETSNESLVFIRNSNSPMTRSPAQFFTVEEWRAFIAGAKAGEFDV